jgi:branched-chain amino acid transport system permease protein
MASIPVPPRTAPRFSKRTRNLLLGALVIYLILMFGPIAGFDLPRIIQDIRQTPGLLIQQTIVGLANGCIIAIIALGYTMVYGIIELINFAHADVFMLGSFMALSVLGVMGFASPNPTGNVLLALFITFIITAVFCGVLNASIERLAYRRLRNAPRLAPLISAIGVSFILVNIGLFWGGLRGLFPFMGQSGASPKAFPDLLPIFSIFEIDVAGFTVIMTAKDLIVIVVSIALMIALRTFVQYTKLGKAMRATAQNRDAARIMGINVDFIIALTFLIGGALGGAGGLIFGLYNNTIVFTLGFTAGLRAFTAAVLGGIGNITGAMLGGVLIGLLAAFSDQYLSSRWTNAWVFAILVVILIFRPTGLLGETVGEKA